MADSIKRKPVAVNKNIYSSRPCTRHPSHRQSPGVCSLCVNEKLATLSTSKKPSLLGGYSDTSSCSLSEVSSCSSSSECLSPSQVRAKYAKRGSISFVNRREKKVEKDDVVLSKSRSMAAAFVRRVKGGETVKKSNGFWSKVLKRTKRKKMER